MAGTQTATRHARIGGMAASIPVSTRAVSRRRTGASSAPRRVDVDGSIDALDLTTFGGRLAFARLKAGVTQEELADAIDRCRGSVVAYETKNRMPAIPIVERLANVLKVSTAYLSFGQNAPGPVTPIAVDNTVTISEFTYGAEGKMLTGTFQFPRMLAESYAANADALSCFIVERDFEAFGLRSGHRVFVDTSVNTLTNRHDRYLIEAGGAAEVIGFEPTVTDTAQVSITGPTGAELKVKRSGLTIIGAIVATLAKN